MTRVPDMLENRVGMDDVGVFAVVSAINFSGP